jgi:hypothetical protein
LLAGSGLLLGLGLGLHFAAPSLCVSGLRAECERSLGPAAEYRVEIGSPRGLRLLAGRFHDVGVVGRDVQIKPDLVLDELRLRAPSLSVQPWSGALRETTSAEVEVFLSTERLNHFLRRKVDPRLLTHLQVTLTDGRMQVTARTPWPPVKIRVVGRVVLTRPTRLDFIPLETEIASFQVPAWVLRLVSQEINPLLECKPRPWPWQWENLRLEPRGLQARGRVTLLPGRR